MNRQFSEDMKSKEALKSTRRGAFIRQQKGKVYGGVLLSIDLKMSEDNDNDDNGDHKEMAPL